MAQYHSLNGREFCKRLWYPPSMSEELLERIADALEWMAECHVGICAHCGRVIHQAMREEPCDTCAKEWNGKSEKSEKAGRPPPL